MAVCFRACGGKGFPGVGGVMRGNVVFVHVEGGFSRVVGNAKENVCSRVCGGGFFRLVRSRGKCLLLRMEGRFYISGVRLYEGVV